MKSNVSAPVLYQMEMPLGKADFAFINHGSGIPSFPSAHRVSVTGNSVFWKLHPCVPSLLGCEMLLPACSGIPLPHSRPSGSDAGQELSPQKLHFVSWCQPSTEISAEKSTGLAEGCGSCSGILSVFKNVGLDFPCVSASYLCVFGCLLTQK